MRDLRLDAGGGSSIIFSMDGAIVQQMETTEKYCNSPPNGVEALFTAIRLRLSSEDEAEDVEEESMADASRAHSNGYKPLM